MLRKIALIMIRWYQNTLSLDHGPRKDYFIYGFCRFTPSCSQYTYESIERYGFFIGGLLGFWRIMRCNPCSHGGKDPIPKTLKFWGKINK